MIDVDAATYNVPPGWHSLVKKLIVCINHIDPDISLIDAKEKFAALKVYTDSGNSRVHDFIDEAEDKSLTICQDCGSTDRVVQVGKCWLRTLCFDCKIRRAESDKL